MSKYDNYVGATRVVNNPDYLNLVTHRELGTSYTTKQLANYWERKRAIAFNKAKEPEWAQWFTRLDTWKKLKLANYTTRNALYRKGRQGYKLEVNRLYNNLMLTRKENAVNRRIRRSKIYEAYTHYAEDVRLMRRHKYQQTSPYYLRALERVGKDKAFLELSELSPLRKNTVVPFWMYLSAAVRTGFVYTSRVEDYQSRIDIFKRKKKEAYESRPVLPAKFTEPRPPKPEAKTVLRKPDLVKNFCNNYFIRSAVSPTTDVASAGPFYILWEHPLMDPRFKSKKPKILDSGLIGVGTMLNFMYKEYYSHFYYHENMESAICRTWFLQHEAQVSNLHNIVLAKIGQKFRGHGFNAGNTLIEADETLKFLYNSVKRLAKAINALKASNYPGVLHNLGLDFSTMRSFRQTMSNADLMYAYALSPLIGDVQSAAEALAVHVVGRTEDGMTTSSYDGYRLRSSKSYISSFEYDVYGPTEVYSGFNARLRVTRKSTYRIIVQLGHGGFDSVPTLVLNDPFQALWEGTFMSFVVDWFLPIQQFLEAMWVVNGNMNIVQAMSSLKDTWVTELISIEPSNRGPVVDYGPGTHCYIPEEVAYRVRPNAFIRTMTFKRSSLTEDTILPHIPKLRPLSDALSIRHIANGSALLSNVQTSVQDANRAASRRAYQLRHSTRRR